MRIVIVENDGDTREMLQSLCDASGIDWAAAGRADAALEMLAGAPWDGVILDLDLRSGPGAIRLLRVIRSTRTLAELIVIVTTGLRVSDPVIIDALLQADEVLVKPYTFDSIVDILRQRISAGR